MVQDAMASLFGIKNVYFALSMELGANSPVEGNLAPIWNNVALLYYSETSPTLKSTSFMKTYAKREGHEVLKVGQDKLAQEAMERDIYSMIRVKNKYDQVIVDAGCAYLINGTTA
jgi:hypothetical protein